MKRRRVPISNINVVPYIDVMLVLLVIFMITAPLFNQGVVNLPAVGEKTALPEQPSGALEIFYEPSGANRFHIINHELNEESAKMNLPELMDMLEQERLLRPQAPLVITADEALQYKEVVELLGRLQEVGYKNIGLKVQTGKHN